MKFVAIDKNSLEKSLHMRESKRSKTSSVHTNVNSYTFYHGQYFLCLNPFYIDIDVEDLIVREFADDMNVLVKVKET